MHDRSLSGRPRQLQVFVVSLVVLIVGLAAGITRSPTRRLAGNGGGLRRRVRRPPAVHAPLAVEAPVRRRRPPLPGRPGSRAAADSVTPTNRRPGLRPRSRSPPRPGAGQADHPIGKGMWFTSSRCRGWRRQQGRGEGQKLGLTHLYTRSGRREGLLRPGRAEQAAARGPCRGIKVIGWDFVYLTDRSPTPCGPRRDRLHDARRHKIDAFSADIESPQEGVNLTAEGGATYGAKLRELVGPSYPLIATVPRPSPKKSFPFAEVTAAFDAIAPMVYWQNRDPATDVAGAIDYLAQFGKPILPRQAYKLGPMEARPRPREGTSRRLHYHGPDQGAVEFVLGREPRNRRPVVGDRRINCLELPGPRRPGRPAVFLHGVCAARPARLSPHAGSAPLSAIAAVQTPSSSGHGNLDAAPPARSRS